MHLKPESSSSQGLTSKTIEKKVIMSTSQKNTIKKGHTSYITSINIYVINLVFLLAFINSNTFMKIQISIMTSITLYPSNKDSRGI